MHNVTHSSAIVQVSRRKRDTNVSTSVCVPRGFTCLIHEPILFRSDFFRGQFLKNYLAERKNLANSRTKYFRMEFFNFSSTQIFFSAFALLILFSAKIRLSSKREFSLIRLSKLFLLSFLPFADRR